MKNCKKIVLISNSTNLGVAKAWNQGLKSVMKLCRYFLVVNNDILFDKDCIDILLKISKERDCLTSAFHETKKEGEDLGIFWSCFLLNKKIIDKVGLFDEFFWPARGEDSDMNFRLDYYGIKYIRPYTANVIHEHNGTAKSLGASQDSIFSNYDWAGALGRNLEYLNNKKKRWGR